MMNIRVGDRVRFVKWDKRMNLKLKNFHMKDGIVLSTMAGVKNQVLVEFGIMNDFWISPSRLELRIPCHSMPHVYNDHGICWHCGLPAPSDERPIVNNERNEK